MKVIIDIEMDGYEDEESEMNAIIEYINDLGSAAVTVRFENFLVPRKEENV